MNQELHQAIITLLSSALGLPVWADAPQDQASSLYVMVQEGESANVDTDTSHGAKVGLDLTVYSSAHGTKSLLAVCDQIHTALNGQSLTLSSAAFVAMWTDGPSLQFQDDGRTHRGVVRLTVLVDDIAPTTA